MPQSSVAVQVRISVKLLAQAPGMVCSSKVTVTLLSQLSVAVTVPGDGTPVEHSIVSSAGISVITGASLSPALIVCTAVVLLPQSSVAVQVRISVKLFAQDPGIVCSSSDTVTLLSQLSVAVTVPGLGIPVLHSIVSSAGISVITGASLSPALIVCTAVVLFRNHR